MKYKPHPYQTQATHFIQTHKVAALFLEMGLGKTITTLTAIHALMLDSFEISKTLIIAPLRVARNTWPQEIAKWDHLRGLRASIMCGSRQERLEALNTPAHLYIVNRENLPWLVKTLGHKWDFDMVIIDELSGFKNHNSKRFRALKAVRKRVKRIVGLTGTPAPNGLIDLWAQIYLLDLGERLGQSITGYRSSFFKPDKRSWEKVFSWKVREGGEDEIYRRIQDITISMRAKDYLHLPEVTYTGVDAVLDTSQERVYQELKEDLVTVIEDEVIDAKNAAVLAGKLLQLASGAIYSDAGEPVLVHEAKLDALEDIVEAANGQPLLVAYWFKHELARITDRFPKARVLSTARDFRDWNDGKVKLGLIHPASAGHGLNLQKGGHLLAWFSLPWSLELYEQTNARLNRQGQTEPVTVTHIIAKGTIDERVLGALSRKQVTQSALIEAVKAQIMDYVKEGK